jgi:hypothetical protein
VIDPARATELPATTTEKGILQRSARWAGGRGTDDETAWRAGKAIRDPSPSPAPQMAGLIVCPVSQTRSPTVAPAPQREIMAQSSAQQSASPSGGNPHEVAGRPEIE